MTYLGQLLHNDGFSEGHSKGLSQGYEKGETLLGQLIQYLLADNRTEDIRQASIDSARREKLYQEYGLSKKCI